MNVVIIFIDSRTFSLDNAILQLLAILVEILAIGLCRRDAKCSFITSWTDTLVNKLQINFIWLFRYFQGVKLQRPYANSCVLSIIPQMNWNFCVEALRYYVKWIYHCVKLYGSFFRYRTTILIRYYSNLDCLTIFFVWKWDLNQLIANL